MSRPSNPSPPTRGTEPASGPATETGHFQRLAIVNRGEPAVRLLHAARELRREQGRTLTTIALYTEPDRAALFVREADEAVSLGEATYVDPRDGAAKSSYLDLERLERALVSCRADAVWVGWGFVAERPEFAELCRDLGLVFVGPRPEVMRRLGDKIEAKRLAEEAGVPVADWSSGPVESADEALEHAERIGYPLLIKAAAGGGGRGIRKIASPEELPAALETARSEALRAFGDGSVFLEQLVVGARHVEVQLAADTHGTVWALGVRDCTLQRRNQKVLEEAPSPALSADEAQEVREASRRLARKAGYTNAGTVEYLFDPTARRFFFMEVNTRLQVEHPVTESTTGVDLVKLQLAIASGERLPPEPPPEQGWAIEVRLNAEDPDAGFAPAPGTVELFRLPAGPGIRVDTGVQEGDTVPPEFDSMIAKIIARGRDRDEALARLTRAVEDTAVALRGGTTNKGFLREMLRRPEIADSTRHAVDIAWLDRLVAGGGHRSRRHAEIALLAAAVEAYEIESAVERERFLTSAARGRPEAGTAVGHRFELRYRGDSYPLRVHRLTPEAFEIAVEDPSAPQPLRIEAVVERHGEHFRRLSAGGRSFRVFVVTQGPDHLVEVESAPHRISRDSGGVVRAPSPAVVVSLAVQPGDPVASGDRLAVVEAMKMETSIFAPFAGRVREVCVRENVQVAAGEPLLLLDPDSEGSDAGIGERLSFELLASTGGEAVPVAAEPSPEHARREDLAALERLALGYDVDTATVDRILARSAPEAHGDEAVGAAQNRLLSIFADVAGLFRRDPEEEGAGDESAAARRSAAEYFTAYLHDLDAEGEGLPAAFLERLERTLAHFGVDSLERSDALEESLLRLHKAHRRQDVLVPALLAILDARLGAPTPSDGEDESGFRQLLDRLINETHEREPAVHDMARELLYHRYDRPRRDALRRQAFALTEQHLAALAEKPRSAELARRVQALVDIPQSVQSLLTARFGSGGGGTPRRFLRRALLEVLLRRSYRLRELGKVAVSTVRGHDLAVTEYPYGGRTIHLLATHADLTGIEAASEVLARQVRKLARQRAAGVDLFLWRGEGRGDAVDNAELLAVALNSAGFPPSLRRAVVTVTGPATVRAGSGDADGYERDQCFTFRPAADGRLEEDTLYRGIHPMTAEELQLWRLSNFALERLPSSDDVYLFRGVAHDNPRDERLFAVAEVRDVTPVKDDDGRVVELPELERVLMEALAGIRRFQSRQPVRRRLLWNRVVLYVLPPLRLAPAEVEGLVHRLSVRAEGHGLQKVVVRSRVADRHGGEPHDRVLEIVHPTAQGATLRYRRPSKRPLATVDEYAQKVVTLRRRGLAYPYEIVARLAPPGGSRRARRSVDSDADPLWPPSGEFVELELDDSGELVRTDRPWGHNPAGIVVGLLRNFTRRHPEGMVRVSLLSDPSRAMGSLGEPECRRILAALELARRLSVPVEWFAVSSGAGIAMDAGTENLDWTARVLRGIVEHTQGGGEINIVVCGVNVGAQSYWDAEATMLMHTRGVLIMTPGGSMVLTGKRALDYSGGVSAEDNQGIGGYERIMGPNGQAQHFARDVDHACRILLDYYRHTYVVPGERFPRSVATADPPSRDVQTFPHGNGGASDFATVGEVFSDQHNPGRKKPFDIRRVMRAVTDQDRKPLERWYGMEDAEVAVVWDAHLGGQPVCLLGFESWPVARHGFVPADGPRGWTSGTLFPLSSKKVARAINSASGNRPLVVLANLSGFDGSPESMRRLQLEHGAEIGRAVVNFQGPIVFCVVSRYHGGAFVVFSRALQDNLHVAALEGTYASVIGGAPAAAVVFSREVRRRTQDDPRITELQARIEEAGQGGGERGRLSAQLDELRAEVHSEKLGQVAEEFDRIHSVERARDVGSVDSIVPPADLRPFLIDALDRGMKRELETWQPGTFEPAGPLFAKEPPADS